MSDRRLSSFSTLPPIQSLATTEYSGLSGDTLSTIAPLPTFTRTHRRPTLISGTLLAPPPAFSLLPTHVLTAPPTQHERRKSILIIPETNMRLVMTERDGEVHGFGELFTGDSVETSTLTFTTRGKCNWSSLDDTNATATSSSNQITRTASIQVSDNPRGEVYSLQSLTNSNTSQTIDFIPLTAKRLAQREYHEKCARERQRLEMSAREVKAEATAVRLMIQDKPLLYTFTLVKHDAEDERYRRRMDEAEQRMRYKVTLPRITPLKTFKLSPQREKYVPWITTMVGKLGRKLQS